MDKSAITMTADDDWWLERVTMDGEQRYPERIRIGSLENPRVYVPERTCHMVSAFDADELEHEQENISFSPEDTLAYRCDVCGFDFRYERRLYPSYCPNCGAKVVSE